MRQHRVGEQGGVVQSLDLALGEQERGTQPVLLDEALGELGEADAVGGGQRLLVAAGHRQHDVRAVGWRAEDAEHPADEGRVQERQVGGGDERDVGPAGERGQAGGDPLERALALARVVDHHRRRLGSEAGPGPAPGPRPPGRPRARRGRRRSGAAASSRATPAPPWACPSARTARRRAPPRPSSRLHRTFGRRTGALSGPPGAFSSRGRPCRRPRATMTPIAAADSKVRTTPRRSGSSSSRAPASTAYRQGWSNDESRHQILRRPGGHASAHSARVGFCERLVVSGRAGDF